MNTKFIQMSGSGGGLEYVDTLPSPPNIKDAIYGYYSTVSYTETVAADFLDDNEYFTKSGNDYTPKPAFYSYQTLTKMCPDHSTRPRLVRYGKVYLASWKRPDRKKVWALWTSKDIVKSKLNSRTCVLEFNGLINVGA